MDNKKKKNNKKPNMWFRIILLVGIIIFFVSILDLSSSTETISYTEFQNKVTNNEVTHINVRGNVIRVLIADSEYSEEEFPEEYDYIVTFINSQALVDFIDDHNETLDPEDRIDAVYNFEAQSLVDRIMPWISIIIFAIIAFIIIRAITSTNSKAMGFSKSASQLAEMPKVKFDNVAGADEEKEELKEVVDFLKNPGKFTKSGARIPKGVLLVGPPGTGKTLLGRAVAGESSVPFFSMSGSDFVEMFVGVGASRVRDLFNQAKKSSPCIIFLDEIDAVGRQRGAGMGGGNDEREQTLNQLLVQMDGFEANEGIIIIAATNRPDVLDPALLRPGRFDRQITVNIPDVGGREKILEVHAKNKKLDDSIGFQTIARMTTGFTGADLENLLNEAAILSVRAGRSAIGMDDIYEGINKVLMGPQKKSRKITERDRKITAYHESGHAIVQKIIDTTEEVQEVSIIPRGMAGGYTLSRPETDDSYYTHKKLIDNISVLMGGRIAEELFIGDITTGASNDIKQATNIARRMVAEFAMGNLGFIQYDSSSDEVFLGRDYSKHREHSDLTATKIDEDIKRILDDNYERTIKVIKEHKDQLEVMAKVLLEKETIYKEEVDMVMDGQSAEDVLKYISEKETAKEKKRKDDLKKLKDEEEKRLKEIKKKTEGVLKKQGFKLRSKSSDTKSTDNKDEKTSIKTPKKEDNDKNGSESN